MESASRTQDLSDRLAGIETPALLLSLPVLTRNIEAMRARLEAAGVAARPHIKTVKCAEVWKRALGDPPKVTVSTLLEAEHAFEHGVADILYAVGIAPAKLERAIALRARGADLTLTVDSLEAADALAAAGAPTAPIPAVVEIDSDAHRAGVKPMSAAALAIVRRLHEAPGAAFRGLMTHAGGSYDCRSVDEIRAMAERERLAVVETAAMLREAGLECGIVSLGSTPTATFAQRFDGVTEVRAGVYMTMDLVMAGLGVCGLEDIALSVLTSVVGRQPGRNQVLVDAGWMALSRDRGTADQPQDQGYGLVCDAQGAPLGDLIVAGANQEHGIIERRGGGPIDMDAFPVGRTLRILPNHACATAAQFGCYVVLDETGAPTARWARLNGW